MKPIEINADTADECFNLFAQRGLISIVWEVDGHRLSRGVDYIPSAVKGAL